MRCLLMHDINYKSTQITKAQIPLRRLARNFPIRRSRRNGIWAKRDVTGLSWSRHSGIWAFNELKRAGIARAYDFV